MSRMRTLGATLSALVLVGAGAAAVTYADQVAPPAAPSTSRVQVHPVPAGVLRLVCAPAPVIPEGATAYDSEFTPIPVTSTAALTAAAVPREDTPSSARLQAGAEPIELEGSEALIAQLTPSDPGAMLVARPVQGVAGLVDAAGLWRSDAGDLRSLTALPCAPAEGEQWLVGGSTVVGSSAALTLANPSETPITVDVSGWGPLGPVDVPMLAGLVLAPGAAETYLLEASDATLERLALRVQASGGSVGASVLHSRLDGFTGHGVDTIGPTAPPALELVIPGVSLAAPAEGSEAPSAPGLVRILNPGTTPATVALALLTASGEAPIPGAVAVTVDPGAVFDVNLDGLPPGEHAVSVTSDHPVVASAQVLRSLSDGGAEAAWVSATLPAARLTSALPGSAGGAERLALVLANPHDDDAPARVTPYGPDGGAGEVRDVVVPARGTVALTELDGAAALAVEADQGLHGALVASGAIAEGELVAVLPAAPDGATAHEVSVEVREN
ncbi:MAG: DUF5719 family protein [bacterium]|nr:DUF5719 family protein [bacterium]